ncbi:MAG TPA: hypothetical protein VFN35_03055, partial [Ktedonobacteraceae bacterium]|nr:hypothetical protein [Ktedonobacteraceae bacterium]
MEGAYPSRKFASPMLPRTILHRETLVTHMQVAIARQPQKDGTRTNYKLVMLCAPAGFGKTTLLADFARSTAMPCCWYFLDSTDNDQAIFLNNLLTSVRCTFPQFGNQLDAFFTNLFAGSSLSIADVYQSAIDTLCATIASEVREHFGIYLCNYEEINGNEAINALITHLLKKLPSQATLVIESRIMPDISLVPLFIRGEVFGLNSDSLRFSAQEISTLARLQGLTTLSAEDAEQLATSFDGWIAGILLSTLLGDLRLFASRKEASDHLHILYLPKNVISAEKRKNLFAYVVGEVFRHDAAMYTFLQSAAILQQMEPDLCNSVLEISNADDYLARLEQQGLFVTSYRNATQTIYTCHPTIRDLLSEELSRQEPERFAAL